MILAHICLVPAIAAQRMNKQTDVGKITFVSPPNLQNSRGKNARTVNMILIVINVVRVF